MPIVIANFISIDWASPTQNIIVASDAAANDHFGDAQNTETAAAGSVFLTRNGQYLFISAVDNDDTFTDEGKVYVYEKLAGTWTEKQIISNPSSSANGEQFGKNISASSDGTHVLIGTSASEFHYYELVTGTWTFRQTVADHETTPANFGGSVDISDDGTVALVGNFSFNQTTAEGYPSNVTAAGKAYIFTRSGVTWSLDKELDSPSPILNGHFGGNFSMSPDGTHAIIGQQEASASSGNVYAFEDTGTWGLSQTLTKSTSHNNMRFGMGKPAMSSDGNTVVVAAAWMTLSATTFVGGAFVYTRSGGVWTEQQLLQPSDGTSFAFGTMGDGSATSISNDGGTVVIGAPAQTTGGQASNGSAYVWLGSPGSYTENSKILPSTAEASQEFGKATAVRNNNEIFVSGGQRTVTATDQGVVYAITP